MLNLEAEPFAKYATRRGAEETLRYLAIENGLCLKYCFLDKATYGCENYNEDICKGACLGVESPEEYNPKVIAALAKYSFEKPDFVIIGEGRAPDESSVVCVENGSFTGMGYIGTENRAYSVDEIRAMVTPAQPHPDIHTIIRSFLKKNKKHDAVIYA